MVIMVMILSDCRQSYYIARNTGRNIMTLSDHQRAKSALNANDLNAAHRYRPEVAVRNLGKFTISGGENRRQRRNERSKSVMMRSISLISLCFEAEEGVPEHPDIMLGYMQKPWRYC
jgi:hypothetical protein